MKKIFLVALVSLLATAGFSQSIVPIRGDSIKIYKVGGNAELILENGTRTNTGAYLKNRWNGRTEYDWAVDSGSLSGNNLIFWRGDGAQNVTVDLSGLSGSSDLFGVEDDFAAENRRFSGRSLYYFEIDSLEYLWLSARSGMGGTNPNIYLDSTGVYLGGGQVFLTAIPAISFDTTNFKPLVRQTSDGKVMQVPTWGDIFNQFLTDPTFEEVLNNGNNLSANNAIDAAGNAFEILNTGVYVLYDVNYILNQVGSGVGSRLFDISTTGISATVNRNPSGSSGFDIHPDSITLRPYATGGGKINITSLRTAADTTLSKPMTYDPATGRVQYLTYWPVGTGGSGTPAGSTTEVQFNDAGAFGADNDFFYNKTTNTLQVGNSGDGGIAYIVGNTDNNAYGPFIIKSHGTGILGTALTLDGTSETGGASWSFLVTGTSPQPPEGAFHFYTPSYGYVASFNINGETILNPHNTYTDLGAYALQVNGSTVMTNGLIVNYDGVDDDFVYKGDTDANLIRGDASADEVHFGGTADLGAFKVQIHADAIVDGHLTVDDEAYDATGWDNDLSVPTKNAVRDKIESLTPSLTLDEDLYTPTGTGITNVAASTTYSTSWVRIGDRVHVFGEVDIDATATGAVELRLSLPAAAVDGFFTGSGEAAGTAVCSASGVAVAISSVSGDDVVALKFIATTTTNDRYSFHFTYLIIHP